MITATVDNLLLHHRLCGFLKQILSGVHKYKCVKGRNIKVCFIKEALTLQRKHKKHRKKILAKYKEQRMNQLTKNALNTHMIIQLIDTYTCNRVSFQTEQKGRSTFQQLKMPEFFFSQFTVFLF